MKRGLYRGWLTFFSVSIVTIQNKKYHPSGNLKFINLGIFQSLKLRILTEKILPISLKLNFTPNTLGCYGLKSSTNTLHGCKTANVQRY